MVYRPIHNVTHSTRQVRLQRALLDCLRIHGGDRVKELLEAMSSTERILLGLASFCLRIGRVDETGTQSPFPDSNGRKVRSAQIFSLYACQLPIHLAPRDEINWVASLVAVACTPDEALPKEITENEKSYFAVQLLATAYELDLYRCYNKKAMQEPIQKTKQFLFIQTGDVEKVNALHSKLEAYALNLMKATGSAI
ncbi:MAG: SidE phosphodiesterase domain-containing protein, partial [Betaproteobacteria bacterium]